MLELGVALVLRLDPARATCQIESGVSEAEPPFRPREAAV